MFSHWSLPCPHIGHQRLSLVTALPTGTASNAHSFGERSRSCELAGSRLPSAQSRLDAKGVTSWGDLFQTPSGTNSWSHGAAGFKGFKGHGPRICAWFCASAQRGPGVGRSAGRRPLPYGSRSHEVLSRPARRSPRTGNGWLVRARFLSLFSPPHYFTDVKLHPQREVTSRVGTRCSARQASPAPSHGLGFPSADLWLSLAGAQPCVWRGSGPPCPQHPRGQLGRGGEWPREDASLLPPSCGQTPPRTGSFCSWPGLHAVVQCGLVLRTHARSHANPINANTEIHFAPRCPLRRRVC